MLPCVLLASLLVGCGGGGGNGGSGGGPPPDIPTLTAIAPSSVAVGASAITLALYGSKFSNQATVQWNGTIVSSSTWINASRMTASIPASNLANVGSAQVTVTNPGTGGGTSSAQTFTIAAAPATTTWVRTVEGISAPDNAMPDPAENIVWDAAHGRLYFSNAYTASAPSNTIAVIDPVAGTVVTSVPAGNDPDLLSISSDSSYLWVGLDGDHAVQRFLLPGLTKDISFPVPTDSSGNPQVAVSLQAAPVSPHTLALDTGLWNNGASSDAVYVYDDATARGVSVPGGSALTWLQWGADDSTIYALANGGVAEGAVATLSVTPSGVSIVSEKGGMQAAGCGTEFTQYDPVNGLLYCFTAAFSPADGKMAGWFNTSPAPFAVGLGIETCTADSSLRRYYCAVTHPLDSTDINQYELWVFDLNTYALLDRVYFGASAGSQISPVTGYPHHLVRWGNAGLALTTKTYGSLGAGGFYLIDGAAVNPKAPADVDSGDPTWSYSWMTSVTPQQAAAGSGNVSITINGNNFTPDSIACWACNQSIQYLPTTYLSSQQLSATIPASLIASSGSFPINVFDSSTSLYSTDSLVFTVTPAAGSSSTQLNAINMAGFAIAGDAQSGLLYVGTADFDSAYPNSIVAVDGGSGSVVKAQTVGADPWVVSVSADGQYVYAGFYGATALTQLQLPGLGSPLTWALSNPASSQAYWAGDMKAAPVSPHTTAVTLFDQYLFPPDTGGLVIYDDNVERPEFLGGWGSGLPGPESYMTLAWGASDEILAAAGAGGPIFDTQISPSGAVFEGEGSDNSFNSCGGEIHSDFGTGLIYSDCGNVADPTTGATVGTYNASGMVAPDSSLNRVFILGQTTAQAGTNNYTIQSFDEKAYTLVSSITLENLQGTPFGFCRWGTSGLAVLMLATPLASVPGMLYLVQDATFVSSAQRAVSRSAKAPDLVQRRWKCITKADIVKMMQVRNAAEAR
jgi:hypothetical protein